MNSKIPSHIVRAAGAALFLCSAWRCAAAADADSEEPLEEIVITGTRLQNANFTAPTPVQVIDAAAIANRAPTQISDVIYEMPAFRVSRSPQGGGRVSDMQAGIQASLDLRGLGESRTLTLINGRRSVATNSNNTVDTNLIPVGLIERVEVVTGGASAAYGSDAVAGVANFILKNEMTGITASVQGGQTERGDGEQYLATLAGGMEFAGGRGHFIGGVDYADTRSAGNLYSRDASESGILPLTAAQRTSLGLPAQVFAHGTELANVTPGGLIQTRTSGGQLYAFDAAGNPVVFNQGTVFGTGTTAQMIGSQSNYGYNTNSAFNLQTANKRTAGYARAQFEFTDALTGFFEANLAHTELPPQVAAFTTVQYQIPRANLPTSLQSLYSGTNVSIGRIQTELEGGNFNSKTANIRRFVLGVDGKLGENWSWQAYYNYGRDREVSLASALALGALYKSVYNCDGVAGSNPNLTAALASQAALYEQLTGKACVPFTDFGVVGDDNAALNYFNYDHNRAEYRYGQDNAVVTVSGVPFALAGNDVSLSVGAERRRDTLDVLGNPLANNGLFYFNNLRSWGGESRVTEGFAEVGVPLLRDRPGARTLDLNAAARRTNYSQSGAVTTWKTGLTYEPVDGLRLRATKSRDIRAPNVRELNFAPSASPSQRTNNIPGTFGYGVTGSTLSGQGGNPDLTPEIADTFTAGVQFRNGSGLSAAVDYYRIEVTDAIAAPSSAQSQNICAALLAQGATSCPGFVFSTTVPNGILSQTDLYQNLNALKVEGIDLELGYRFASLPFGLPGRAGINGSFNYAMHNQQVLLTGTFETAGSSNGVPRVSGNINLSYELARFSADLQFRGFSSVKYDTVSLLTPVAAGNNPLVLGPEDEGYATAIAANQGNTINRNHFAGMVYNNLTLGFAASDNVQLFGVINNLWDRDPPEYAAYAITTTGRNLNYDLLGRAYKLGVRVKF